MIRFSGLLLMIVGLCGIYTSESHINNGEFIWIIVLLPMILLSIVGFVLTLPE